MRRNLYVLVIIWSLLAPSTYAASAPPQTERARASQAASVAPATRPQQAPASSSVLANGLEVIVLEDHSVPLVTLELAVKNGSTLIRRVEWPLAPLRAHVLQDQPRRRRQSGLPAIDRPDGIAYNGSTREEVVNYYFTTTTRTCGLR